MIHFNLTEFTPPGARLTPAVKKNLEVLMGELEKIRVLLGNKPMTITSGYRSIVWEKSRKRSGNSRHCLGEAADFTHATLTPAQVQAKLANWPGGLGYGKNFTHVDIRHLSTSRPTQKKRVRWDYG
jgi:zinc D-Ala-D-Ala carboxypeptidase